MADTPIGRLESNQFHFVDASSVAEWRFDGFDLLTFFCRNKPPTHGVVSWDGVDRCLGAVRG